MQVFIVEDYDAMSKKAAELFIDRIQQKPDLTLGLATGSTPEGLYRELVAAFKEGTVDFANVHSFNLDEYVGLDWENEQSYHYFMNSNLFDHVNIDKSNTHFPYLPEEGKNYDEDILAAGGVDVQLLGVGRNGHIAFNEPGDHLNVATSKVDLKPSTIEANSRFFASEEEVPKQAVSMGLGSIMKAKELVILASGADKSEPIQLLLQGDKVTTNVPITLALLHPNATLIVDKAAAGK